MASSFFEETIGAYDALSSLDPEEDEYEDDYTEEDDHSQDDEIFGVLGGSKISIGTGDYDISGLDSDSLLIAASDELSISGQLSFNGVASDSSELILMSAGKLSIEEGSSVSFTGDSLGFGSFDSMDIINVDLQAEGEIHARSLDNLVITNSEMRTSGNGADFVHLIAANELAVNNLRFSEQIREITMQAMTINLWNVNFPENSQVELNSLYGGIDGRYPNFGSQAYGRVNFVENIRYNSNLINSNQSFDLHGSSISIGSIK